MKLKKLLSCVLALAMVLSLVGAVQPHAHALELHEHTDDDCGCPVEETDAVEEVEEPEESEESETAEEPVETKEPAEAEEPGDAEENGTTDEAQPEDAAESENEDNPFGTPVYDENGELLYFHVMASDPPRDDSEYQLTEEQLALPTEELLELVLNSWLVQENIIYSDSSNNYEWMYQGASLHFNGIRELETRTDVAQALVVKLLEYFEKCDSGHTLFQLEVLDMLLQIPIFQNRMSAAQWNTVAQATAKRYDVSAEEVLSMYGQPVSYAVEMSNEKAVSSEEENDSPAVLADTTEKTIKSFGGKTVWVLIVDPSLEWTAAEKASVLASSVNEHDVDVLGNPTKIYNCHSYAWYQQSTLNPYWINAITGYLEDGHTTKLADSSNVKAGMIAVYRDRYGVLLHSAIVESVNGDEIICVSKWGQGGLFRHKLRDVPESYSTDNTGRDFNITYYTYEKVHHYTMTYKDSGYHSKTCTACGNVVSTEAHSYTYTANGASGHTRKCKSCGYSVTESHTADSLTGKCKYCKYDLSSSPVLPTRKKKLGVVVALAEPRTPAPKRPVLSC